MCPRLVSLACVVVWRERGWCLVVGRAQYIGYCATTRLAHELETPSRQVALCSRAYCCCARARETHASRVSSSPSCGRVVPTPRDTRTHTEGTGSKTLPTLSLALYHKTKSARATSRVIVSNRYIFKVCGSSRTPYAAQILPLAARSTMPCACGSRSYGSTHSIASSE